MLALMEVNEQTEANAAFVLFLDSKAFCKVSAVLLAVWKEEKQAHLNMFLGLSENMHMHNQLRTKLGIGIPPLQRWKEQCLKIKSS